MEDKEYLTPSEAAEFFGLSRRKFFRLCENVRHRFVALYGTRKLIIKDELKRYLAMPGMKEELKNGLPRTTKRLEA